MFRSSPKIKKSIAYSIQKRYRIYFNDQFFEEFKPWRKINDNTQIEDDVCAPEIVEEWVNDKENCKYDWEDIRNRTRDEVNFIWSTIDHKDKPLSDFKHKTKIMLILEDNFGIDIPSYALREMKTKESIIDWLVKRNQLTNYMNWRVERLLHNNTPSNLKVQLPFGWNTNRFDPWGYDDKIHT